MTFYKQDKWQVHSRQQIYYNDNVQGALSSGYVALIVRLTEKQTSISVMTANKAQASLVQMSSKVLSQSAKGYLDNQPGNCRDTYAN